MWWRLKYIFIMKICRSTRSRNSSMEDPHMPVIQIQQLYKFAHAGFTYPLIPYLCWGFLKQTHIFAICPYIF